MDREKTECSFGMFGVEKDLSRRVGWRGGCESGLSEGDVRDHLSAAGFAAGGFFNGKAVGEAVRDSRGAGRGDRGGCGAESGSFGGGNSGAAGAKARLIQKAYAGLKGRSS